jgi:small-conductance mechanosensitive channel
LGITIEFFKYYIKVIRMANEDSLGKALTKVIIYSVIFVVAMGIVQWFFTGGLQMLYSMTGISAILGLENYSIYAIILVLIIFGWFVIVSVASMFYAIFKPKYGESTASAIRSLIKILGIGGLFAGIAGAVGGGVAGVALGGFIGLVIGFATQQVLGQAIAGVFLLLSKPFEIGDVIDVAGETDIKVLDINAMFTKALRTDGNIVLIPNNMIISQKIVIKKKNNEQK